MANLEKKDEKNFDYNGCDITVKVIFPLSFVLNLFSENFLFFSSRAQRFTQSCATKHLSLQLFYYRPRSALFALSLLRFCS